MKFFDRLIGLPHPMLHHWGYWVIFLAAMLEASPLFGLVIPGQSIVILGGFLVKLGILDIGDTLFFAILGAILGDLIGFSLGRKYGYSFISQYGKYVRFKKEHFEKTKKLMRDHTGKTLIIGRFNPLTRAFAPFVAGASDISIKKFLPLNILGSVMWGVTFVMIGYVSGGGYQLASKYVRVFIIIAIIVSVLIIGTYRFINKRKHIFKRYYLYTLILNIFSLYFFTKMIEDVIDGELIMHLDVLINAKVMLFWNPLLNKIMIGITSIANPLNLFLLSLLLFGILIYRKKWYHSLLLMCSMLGGLLFEFLTKLIIHRSRPENGLITVSGYSFPSGHATMAIIFFTIIILAFKDDIKSTLWRNCFIAINILLFFFIGVSRVYLNVHWFSDILAGFSLGLFWLTLLILIFKTIIALGRVMNKSLLLFCD